MKNKLYILTDKTLDPIYAAVQGGHAVAEWMMENVDHRKCGGVDDFKWTWQNDYLIYLAVDIEKWWNRLINYNSLDNAACFWEPDLGNKLTAIAIRENDLNSYLKNKIKKEELLK